MNQETKATQHEHAENPETFTGLKLTLPKDTAAGPAGVLMAMKHVFTAPGLILMMNAVL